MSPHRWVLEHSRRKGRVPHVRQAQRQDGHPSTQTLLLLQQDRKLHCKSGFGFIRQKLLRITANVHSKASKFHSPMGCWGRLISQMGTLHVAVQKLCIIKVGSFNIFSLSESERVWGELSLKCKCVAFWRLQSLLCSPRFSAAPLIPISSLQIEEVPGELTQDDLATDDVMILDTWEQVKKPGALNVLRLHPADLVCARIWCGSLLLLLFSRCSSGSETRPRRRRRRRRWRLVRNDVKMRGIQLNPFNGIRQCWYFWMFL